MWLTLVAEKKAVVGILEASEICIALSGGDYFHSKIMKLAPHYPIVLKRGKPIH